MTAKIAIGIDPGTHTGFAVKNLKTGKFEAVRTLEIHKALDLVSVYCKENGIENVVIFVEDARQRKWIPKTAGREVLQGAGSVKRDCSIWEGFLKDLGCTFHMIPPQQHRTKWPKAIWEKAMGWKGQTSEHARDAAILIHSL